MQSISCITDTIDRKSAIFIQLMLQEDIVHTYTGFFRYVQTPLYISIQYQICTIFKNIMNYHVYHYLPNLNAMLSISKDSNARK